MQIERERDARLLSEAICERVLARRDWGTALNKYRNPSPLSRKELAQIHDECIEAICRYHWADKEVPRLTDIIEKRALETAQIQEAGITVDNNTYTKTVKQLWQACARAEKARDQCQLRLRIAIDLDPEILRLTTVRDAALAAYKVAKKAYVFKP